MFLMIDKKPVSQQYVSQKDGESSSSVEMKTFLFGIPFAEMACIQAKKDTCKEDDKHQNPRNKKG